MLQYFVFCLLFFHAFLLLFFGSLVNQHGYSEKFHRGRIEQSIDCKYSQALFHKWMPDFASQSALHSLPFQAIWEEPRRTDRTVTALDGGRGELEVTPTLQFRWGGQGHFYVLRTYRRFVTYRCQVFVTRQVTWRPFQTGSSWMLLRMGETPKQFLDSS